jgi:hypothetical protein
MLCAFYRRVLRATFEDAPRSALMPALHIAPGSFEAPLNASFESPFERSWRRD